MDVGECVTEDEQLCFRLIEIKRGQGSGLEGKVGQAKLKPLFFLTQGCVFVVVCGFGALVLHVR